MLGLQEKSHWSTSQNLGLLSSSLVFEVLEINLLYITSSLFLSAFFILLFSNPQALTLCFPEFIAACLQPIYFDQLKLLRQSFFIFCIYV